MLRWGTEAGTLRQMTTDTRHWVRVATRIAEPRHLVAGRRELMRAGVPRWVVRLEIRRGRWQSGGRQAVVLHNGPLSDETLRAIAVVEVGSMAALDAVSALQEAGLVGLSDRKVVVSTPKSSTPRRPRGVVVKETRRFREEDVLDAGVRRMKPPVAAVHAALWAVSDKQATLFLTMTVQQGLCTVAALADALTRVRRHRRRRMIARLLVDLAGGSQSLGELDLVRAFRRRGLPVPVRQSMRKRPNGKQYLDCEFPDYDLVIEVDGAGHLDPLRVLLDVIRDITLASEGSTVIRIPLVAWRLDEGAILDVLEQLFRARGWGVAAA